METAALSEPSELEETSLPSSSDSRLQHMMALSLPENFTIDVHTHPIPPFYREALSDAGYAYDGKTVTVDGYATPNWTLDAYFENRENFGFNYSVLSITAPGVAFLNGTEQACHLARQLNDQMFEWSEEYPEALGAVCVLPLPNVEASLEEIEYCLDTLKFEGVGMYSNCDGLYLGDPFYDAIFAELDRRAATVFVHPTHPTPEVKLKGLSSPAIEYTFDTTRAITKMLISGSRKRHPNIKFIFSHGGGTLPFLAGRIAGNAALGFQGGLNPAESIAEMKGYYFDLAAVTSVPQCAALDAFVNSTQLLLGSDTPYFPDAFLPMQQAALYSFPGFSADDFKMIRHENALSVFPRIAEKLAGLNAKKVKPGTPLII